MSSLSDYSLINATKETVHCNVEDETVILGLKDGLYYGLNPSGAFIWNLIQEPIMVTEICDAILEEYDVEKDTCRRDLMNLLQELLDNGLIEVEEIINQ
ncbi:PqqD family protein [Methanobacterium sp.]|uniref:PqqD family protein n=1 Tax=Methanobacterium sp. TaxID=2164 RepID=UPI003C72A05C